MSEESKEIKRWTARRKAEVVMDIIKGKTTAAEVARSHDLTVGEVERWMDDFVSMGTEALRSHPRDAEARHKAKEKELLAKIGELTMEKEVWKVTREILGKPLPDAES
jgi:transposase-like protein